MKPESFSLMFGMLCAFISDSPILYRDLLQNYYYSVAYYYYSYYDTANINPKNTTVDDVEVYRSITSYYYSYSSSSSSKCKCKCKWTAFI